MSPVHALIFDMDGTMIDSLPWHTRSWIEMFRRHGLEIDAAEVVRRTNGRNGTECIREVFGHQISDESALALVHEKESLYRQLFGPVFEAVAGIKPFVAHARNRGLKLGVGSAGDRHNLEFAFSNLALDAPLHAVVGGDEGFPGKPEPAIFLEAARRLGVDAETCIVFEDAPFGIEAARRAGMRAIAMCTTHRPDELDGPHVLAHVRDYHELLKSDFLGKLHDAT